MSYPDTFVSFLRYSILAICRQGWLAGGTWAVDLGMTHCKLFLALLIFFGFSGNSL